MQVLRFVLVGAAILLASALPAFAQRVQVQPKVIQRLGGDAPLLSADALEKLKLTGEQKDKYTKIEAEYKDKSKSAQDQYRQDLRGAAGDRAKLKEVQEKSQADSKKLREDTLAKVEPILTADQKKAFAEVKQQPARPQPGPGVIRVQPFGGGVGQVLPPAAQQRLNLTDEQKKQIEAIQKEVEAKILKVLTDDQKKQFEELKKGGVRPLPIRPRQPNPAIQNRQPAPAVQPAVPKVRE